MNKAPPHLKLPIWANPHALPEAHVWFIRQRPSSAAVQRVLPPLSGCTSDNATHREACPGLHTTPSQLLTRHMPVLAKWDIRVCDSKGRDPRNLSLHALTEGNHDSNYRQDK